MKLSGCKSKEKNNRQIKKAILQCLINKYKLKAVNQLPQFQGQGPVFYEI